jgi:isoleucyl-tRNA synthetase
MTHIQKNKKNRQLFFTYSILTNLCQVFLTFRPFSATIPSQEANIKSSFMADSAPKSQFPGMEEEVLQFWQTNQIFEQSITKDAPHGDYVFYDGPPFATGTPHYGHLVGSIIKDVVPRFWTMKGYRVERKWGWDCHGLPIENIIEKDLGFKTKQDIVSYGVDKFNAACRERVLEYAEDWQKTITRLGRWADMTSPYRTMDLPYMESVWSVFKKLYDQGLIYEGYRSMYVCPRCETTLSQSEVSEGYRDIKDLSAIAKFELADDPGTFVLAWTTTPWTLIANVALAVGADIDYVTVELATERFVLAKSRVADLFKDQAITIINELKGSELVGKKYQPVFDYYAQDQALKNHASGWQILAADFVTTEDGTGVVHIAPAFGEDDLNLGKAYELPFIQHLGMDGIIKSEAGDFAGLSVKPIDDHSSTDVAIIKYLAGKKLLFSKAKYEHSYPHCWRCDTPLINYATGSWFVKVTDLKPTALAAAETINWSPAHIKDGRFGQWLTGARDWSISRQRFWASCLPIWKCGSCSKFQVFGSIAELEEASGLKITDLHKDTLDPIELSCSCGGQMKRIPDVLDCWFESGSMPYAQLHYPFENQEKFNQTFPAKFIAEGQDQTRTWFLLSPYHCQWPHAKSGFPKCHRQWHCPC